MNAGWKEEDTCTYYTFWSQKGQGKKMIFVKNLVLTIWALSYANYLLGFIKSSGKPDHYYPFGSITMKWTALKFITMEARRWNEWNIIYLAGAGRVIWRPTDDRHKSYEGLSKITELLYMRQTITRVGHFCFNISILVWNRFKCTGLAAIIRQISHVLEKFLISTNYKILT